MTFKNSLNEWFRSNYFAITSTDRLMWYKNHNGNNSSKHEKSTRWTNTKPRTQFTNRTNIEYKSEEPVQKSQLTPVRHEIASS